MRGGSPATMPGVGNTYGTTRSRPCSAGSPAASQSAHTEARWPSSPGSCTRRRIVSSCSRAAVTGAPAAASASRSTSARAGTSVPGSRTPSQTSPAGSCRRQSSLHTTGTGRLTGTLPRRRGGGYHRGMPRVPDLGITLGLLPPGPTGSVLDVPGAGLGHATVWRDEPPRRPAGAPPGPG